MSAPAHGAPGPTERDVRPEVAAGQGRGALYLFVAGMVLLTVLLFNALNGRRHTRTSPETRPAAPDLSLGGASPPALFVPPSPDDLPPRSAVEAPAQAFAVEPRAADLRGREPAGGEASVHIHQPPLQIFQPPPASYGPPNPGAAGELSRASGSPVLVFDVTNVESGGAGAAAAGAAATAAGGPQVASRVRSSRLANPSTTVPQGTSIPAVLETALDSTRPGQARAIVSLDVRGFDGTKILIPRGSRLYGEYQADLQAGQNRALIQWTRLLRPDGVVIAIGSPAADRLGRAGVQGKVDSHFLERFFAAALQSSLDVGVAVASRSVSNGGVVLLPGSLSQAVPRAPEVKPTLTVDEGRSIAVLVAHDLDFAAASGR
jgi:type IV secretion system protein VirB10